jgi:hypothetical protein
MKTRLLTVWLSLAALGAPLLLPNPVRAQDEQQQDEVSFDFFYDSLRPYGEWIQVADYGLCWKPNDVAADWAPYTDGYWAYTDGGWTWVSYEDFGGIVYHYGRWTNVEDEGWCWVPDYDWGPAWVAWRSDDEHVGWAPLPPEARFDRETGVSTWVDEQYDIGPTNYHFCRTRDFGAPVIREVLLPEPEVIEIVRYCPPCTNIYYEPDFGFPFCGGPRFDFIAPLCFHPIPTLALVRETNIVNINNTVINNRVVFQNTVRGNTLRVPAPALHRPATNPATNPRFAAARTVPGTHVNHGWNRVPPDQRTAIRAAYKQQTAGATPAQAHAKPPTKADLAPVPKANPNAPVATRRPSTVRPGAGAGATAGTNRSPTVGANRPGAMTNQNTPQGLVANPGKAGAGRGAGPVTGSAPSNQRPGAGAAIPGLDANRPATLGAGAKRPATLDDGGVPRSNTAKAGAGKAGAVRPPASVPSHAVDDTPRSVRPPASDAARITRTPSSDGPRSGAPVRTPASDGPHSNPVNRAPVSSVPHQSAPVQRSQPRPQYDSPVVRQAPVQRVQPQPQISRPQPQQTYRPPQQIAPRPQPQVARPQPQVARPQQAPSGGNYDPRKKKDHD